jgi:hypothetical protein
MSMYFRLSQLQPRTTMRLTRGHLQGCMRIVETEMKPDIERFLLPYDTTADI